MKMHAFSFDHPEQRIELASIRDRLRIHNQGLCAPVPAPGLKEEWILKHVQDDVA